LFGGNSTTESVTLAAKFSNISSEVQLIQNNTNQTKVNLIAVENVTQTYSTFSNATIHNNSTIDKISSNSDSFFTIGLGIGIGVGIAIGIVLFLIFRQKPNK